MNFLQKQQPWFNSKLLTKIQNTIFHVRKQPRIAGMLCKHIHTQAHASIFNWETEKIELQK